jgi:hypothetical protein
MGFAIGAGPRKTRRHRALAGFAAGFLLAGGFMVAIPPAAVAVTKPGDCQRPQVPSRFHKQVVTAIHASGNLPMAWADSSSLAKIVCWQDTSFDPEFFARAPWHRWHGEFAMTVEEMKTIAGPWLSNDRHELILQARCFVHGWDACPHKTANTRVIQQLIAGMRWIWLVYGRPIVAWRHVAYRDDFGVPRGTGGYHPHSGNDIHAPTGRAIRAPFAGLAVAHTDDWFAGRSVGLVGAEGYARNAHLSRFAHLGYVRAGAVIGYVGQTGDALTPHDHFSWHPWTVPDPLHVAPSGFQRVLDAIDPFPFLNRVCAKV